MLNKLGAMAGYGIGYFFWDTVGQLIINFYHAQEAYFEILTVIFTVLLVGGFLAIKYVF